jgi:hypothetical protein
MRVAVAVGMKRLRGSSNIAGKILVALGVASALAGCAGGAPEPEQEAAHAALQRWNDKKPSDYTFVIVPERVHSDIIARIRVKDGSVIEQKTRQGDPAGYDGFTMDVALQEAIDTAAVEQLYVGSYDPDLGYLQWYDVAEDRSYEGPHSGVDITCFEPSIAESACNVYF